MYSGILKSVWFAGVKSWQEKEVSALKVRLAEAKEDLQKAKKENAQVLSQKFVCLV